MLSGRLDRIGLDLVPAAPAADDRRELGFRRIADRHRQAGVGFHRRADRMRGLGAAL
jgi:hypothetical protein